MTEKAVIEKISVVGLGRMGSQIALKAATSGIPVSGFDSEKQAVDAARKWVDEYLRGRIEKGKMTQEQVDSAKKMLAFAESLEDCCRESDLVIEAVVEDIEVKRRLFAELDRVCQPNAILVTNSSSIVSSRLADATNRPAKVCNMHFFNPAMVMELVEVVKGPHTAPETAQAVFDLAKRMGKVPIILEKEVFGFVVNRILMALMREAYYLVEQGVATPEAIDIGVTKGLGHPMGPFRLQDMFGIDVSYRVAMERYRLSGDPKDLPSPLIVEKYEKGEWGRKTGKGWYVYKD